MPFLAIVKELQRTAVAILVMTSTVNLRQPAPGVECLDVWTGAY